MRKHLPHDVPAWVQDGATYFVTICTPPKMVNQLCFPNMAMLLRESMNFCQARGEWWLHLLVFMPDHLHALMCFARAPGMRRSISQWKRYVARELHIHWQDGFFDHRLRNDESFQEKAHYIRMNPVRAGLVERPEEWPYTWSNMPIG
jgi:putative transposase